MNFRQNIRRILRHKVRTRYLKICAVIFGVLAAALLVLAFVQGDFLSGHSYIAGFNVQEISDDGEVLHLAGGDGESLSLSRQEMGSDIYFKVKKAVREGVFVRASVYQGKIRELQVDGDVLCRPPEDVEKHLRQSVLLLVGAVFCMLICASFIISTAAIRRSRMPQKRKNKK